MGVTFHIQINLNKQNYKNKQLLYALNIFPHHFNLFGS